MAFDHPDRHRQRARTGSNEVNKRPSARGGHIDLREVVVPLRPTLVEIGEGGSPAVSMTSPNGSNADRLSGTATSSNLDKLHSIKSLQRRQQKSAAWGIVERRQSSPAFQVKKGGTDQLIGKSSGVDEVLF
jgi:hypothetical protein